MTARSQRGYFSHRTGEAAEDRIARTYEQRGYTIARRRWRGPGGEIDLIARDGHGIVFVEVKQSRNFAQAAERLSVRQMERICASAESYLAEAPDGALTNVRFDVALVDRTGDFRIVENAFGHD